LHDLVRQIAIRVMDELTGKRANVLERLEILVHAGRGESLVAREHAHLPITSPRTVTQLAPEMPVARSHAKRAMHRFPPLTQRGERFAKFRRGFFVGVER